MNSDSKFRIAILGAGPIGIEAALYARFLGYPVIVYEQGSDVCEHVRQWGHVQLFTPFAMNCSSLGRRALEAQDPNHRLPNDEDLHTGHQWVDQYLGPLAETDLVRSSIKKNLKVEAVGRTFGENETENDAAPFRILVRHGNEKQFVDKADVVIDATGSWGQSNPFGAAGMPALGEARLESAIAEGNSLFSRTIPDLQQLDLQSRTRFVVVGSGFSAATNVLQIERLRQRHPDVTCTWITRRGGTEKGPLPERQNDPLSYRKWMAQKCNELATRADWVTWIPSREIAEVDYDAVARSFRIQLSDGREVESDHLLANTGFAGDYRMLDALQVHRCYASGGPMAWAASIVDSPGDCLQQVSAGPDALRTTEPDFYIIGSKSYGKDSRFLFATGLQQIRDLFKIIAGRDTLNLYASMEPTLTENG